MKIIDTKRDFYDYLSNDSDSLVFNRENSISLVEKYPDIFSLTSTRDPHKDTNTTRTAVLIVVDYGEKANTYIRVWEKDTSTLYLNPYQVGNGSDILWTFQKAMKVMHEVISPTPLAVEFLELEFSDYWRPTVRDVKIVHYPIISGSILEYVLSAKSIYDGIEEFLLMSK